MGCEQLHRRTSTATSTPLECTPPAYWSQGRHCHCVSEYVLEQCGQDMAAGWSTHNAEPQVQLRISSAPPCAVG
jgi:hypothetical protein